MLLLTSITQNTQNSIVVPRCIAGAPKTVSWWKAEQLGIRSLPPRQVKNKSGLVGKTIPRAIFVFVLTELCVKEEACFLRNAGAWENLLASWREFPNVQVAVTQRSVTWDVPCHEGLMSVCICHERKSVSLICYSMLWELKLINTFLLAFSVVLAGSIIKSTDWQEKNQGVNSWGIHKGMNIPKTMRPYWVYGTFWDKREKGGTGS